MAETIPSYCRSVKNVQHLQILLAKCWNCVKNPFHFNYRSAYCPVMIWWSRAAKRRAGMGCRPKRWELKLTAAPPRTLQTSRWDNNSFISRLKNSLFSSSMYFKTPRGENSWQWRPGTGTTCRRGRSGAASWTFSSPWWATQSAWATSGGSPTSASEMEEVSES